MVERGLRAAGHRTGRYTSPHLDSHRGAGRHRRRAHRRSDVRRASPSDVLARRSIGCARAALLAQLPTFFEATTAIAFEVFRRQARDGWRHRGRARRPLRRHQRHRRPRSPPSRRSRSTTSGTWVATLAEHRVREGRHHQARRPGRRRRPCRRSRAASSRASLARAGAPRHRRPRARRVDTAVTLVASRCGWR